MIPVALFAGLIAFSYLVKAVRQPRLAVILAAILWALYAIYEWLVATAVLCDAKCDIRVDLVLMWPVLLIASALARVAPGQWRLALWILAGIALPIALTAVGFTLFSLFDTSP